MTSTIAAVSDRTRGVGALVQRPGAVTLVLIAATVGLRVWVPSDDSTSAVCFVRRCTGTACPGCGLTRALAFLVRGDLASMWAMHPLAPLFAIDAVAVAALLWVARSGRALKPHWIALWAGIHVPLLLGIWMWRAVIGTLPI